ncbi:MAG: hypothetical protein AAF358_13750 [Pseudomonadota bacterium]
MLFFRSKTLFAKLQPTALTDSVPIATDAVQVFDLEIDPYEGDTVEETVEREQFGNYLQFNTSPTTTMRFKVYLKGTGSAGDAAFFGPLLRGCGFAETLNASTDATYDLVSTGQEMLTLKYVLSGNQVHAALDCRGTVRLEFTRGGLPYLQFEFTGAYVEPVTSALAADISAWEAITTLPVNRANTVFTLDSTTPCLEQLVADVANEVVSRDLPNCYSTSIVDRSPNGNCNFEAPTLATKDWFDVLESHNGVTTVAGSIVHGSTAGNIIEVQMPRVQLAGISFENSDGILVYNTNARFIPVAGNDEIQIIVR